MNRCMVGPKPMNYESFYSNFSVVQRFKNDSISNQKCIPEVTAFHLSLSVSIMKLMTSHHNVHNNIQPKL